MSIEQLQDEESLELEVCVECGVSLAYPDINSSEYWNPDPTLMAICTRCVSSRMVFEDWKLS